jgi:hypothetical protein
MCFRNGGASVATTERQKKTGLLHMKLWNVRPSAFHPPVFMRWPPRRPCAASMGTTIPPRGFAWVTCHGSNILDRSS